jgi:hypothetical protein
MIIANILFLFRKARIIVEGGLDLVQPPNMAHSLLYSKNYAERDSKKRSNKVRFLLDKPAIPCYNGNITITNQPNAALPVNYCQIMPIVRTTGKKLD